MPRISLASISDNLTCCKELTPYQRDLIVGTAFRDTSTVKIQKKFFTSELMIQTVISQASEQDHEISKPQSDCLKCCSMWKQHHIIHTAQIQLNIIYHDLIKITEINCSKFTVYWILKKYELINWLAKKHSLLQEKNAANRLVWVKEWKNWDSEKWRNVIWMNECSVKQNTDKNRK